MKIAPFAEADRSEILRLHRETFEVMKLERFSWQVCQQIESLEKDALKIVCREKSGVQGYAAAYAVGEGSFRLNLLVGLGHRRQGIGARLLDEIERQAREVQAEQLEARIIEGMDESLSFVLSKNFTELHRMRGISLHARDFSFEKWRALGEKLATENLTITNLAAEERAGQNPLENLCELQKSAVQDWPLTNFTMTVELSAERLRRYFSFITVPETVSIMKHGEQYVAYTSAEPQNVLGTATHPAYRGRGIATYLKAVNLKKLIDAGTNYFESTSANPLMIKVNEKLGYQLNNLAEIRLAKRL